MNATFNDLSRLAPGPDGVGQSYTPERALCSNQPDLHQLEKFMTSEDIGGATTQPQEPPLPKTQGELPVMGHIVGSGEALPINMEALVRGRLFIQAASGGGKSYAMRRLLEQTHGMIQQIVIDPEGELVTLAEQFDFQVLEAGSAEAPLTVGNGAHVADTIHLSGHSTILDLQKFELHDMQTFVASFVKALVEMPKDRWRYVMLVIDEAQIFAPQQGKAESKNVMCHMAAVARKRGITPVIATQRISQLCKAVVAHLESTLVGLTTLTNDVDRVAVQLGMRKQEAAAILPDLQRGEFLASGPAFGKGIQRVKIGPVLTAHGTLGAFTAEAPPKTMSAQQLLQAVRAYTEEQAQARKKEAAGQSVTAAKAPSPQAPQAFQQHSPDDAVRAEIAATRYWVIQPLLERGCPHGSLIARCQELGLNRQEVYRWVKGFREQPSLDVLAPKTVRRKMRAYVARLAPLMQAQAPTTFSTH